MEQVQEYTIAIRETLTKEFIVTAPSPADALNIAEQKYHEATFILDRPSCVIEKDISISKPDDKVTSWIIF